MAKYRIELKKSVQKDFGPIPKKDLPLHATLSLAGFDRMRGNVG